MTPLELLESGRVTISRAEAARILGIDVRTVTKAIDRGELPAARYAGRVLVLVRPLMAQLSGLSPPGNAGAGPQLPTVTPLR